MKRLILILVFVLTLAIGGYAQSLVTLQNGATGTGNGQVLTLSPTGSANGASVQVVMSGTATITFEATFDSGSSNWTAVAATNVASGTAATTATASGIYTIAIPGAQQVRARISSYSSGTVTVKGRAQPAYVTKNVSGGGGGSGTVTDVSVVTANGVSGSVANSTTTPAITLTLGAITPSTIVATGTISATTGFKIGGAAASRKILVGDGTNFVASTETYAVPGTSGNVLTSDGTNWTSAAPAGSGANTALSNLASVAINTPLVFASGQLQIGPNSNVDTANLFIADSSNPTARTSIGAAGQFTIYSNTNADGSGTFVPSIDFSTGLLRFDAGTGGVIQFKQGVQADASTDIGAAGAPFRDFYLYGSGTYSSTSIKLTGTPTGNRVVTFPDASITVARTDAGQTFTGTQAFGALTATGTIVQTSASATAFESGPNGSTNPVFRLVNSVASAATGLSITGNASGGGVTLTALGGTNEEIAINPKGNKGVAISGSVLAAYNSTNGYSLSAHAAGYSSSRVQINAGDNGTIKTIANAVIGWASSTVSAGTNDTGLSRNAVAAVEVNNGTAGQWGSLLVGVRDAGTTTVTNGLTVGHQSTGTPAAGLGSAVLFNINSSTTADQAAGQLSYLWTDATHATRTSAFVIKTVNNAAALAEQFRVAGDGTLTIGTGIYTSCTALTTNGSAVIGCIASDERLKQNLTPFNAGMDVIRRIQPISFSFKPDTFYYDGREKLGLSAQNLKAAHPLLASTFGSAGLLQPEPLALHAVEIDAIKQLDARVKILEAEVLRLKQERR